MAEVALTRPAPERRSKNIFDVPGEIMRKGFLRFIEDLWKEKGDLVMIKIGPRQMFLAVHPEHVRQISITNRKNYDKLGAYDTVRKLLLGKGLVTSTGETWRRQRSLMAPYFTPRYIDNYYEVMLREGEELLKRWENGFDEGKEA